MRNIVIGLHDSPHTQELIDWTTQFAHEMNAHVTLVHVVQRTEVWTLSGAMLDSNRYLDSLREHFERRVAEPLRRRGVPVDLRVELGEPAQELADTAERVDAALIIIGAPSHGVLRELIEGIGHRVERLASVPVVVLPFVKHGQHAHA
jgi:nucleotide-binding universal stress UspA family protein